MAMQTTCKSFKQNDPNATPTATDLTESWIDEIQDWMRQNQLKLNDDKTDILLFSSNPLIIDPFATITIDTEQICYWQEPRCHP